VADLLITEPAHQYTGYGRVLDRACKALAVLAGVVLAAMAFMSLWSIGGRALFGKALTGDYELVQFMTAVAVAMSLPYANWIGGHVIVDFFTARSPVRTNALLDSVAYGVMALFSFLIAGRLALGMLDLQANQDASMLLSIPTWWAFAPMVPSFVLLGLTALYQVHVNFEKLRA
jgi:TRAP-type C4-dicarboxylate transport system permease small subunit